MRRLAGFCLAAVAAVATTDPVAGLVMAAKAPVQRAVTADVVVVGKVTAIEKEAVEVAPVPNAPNKLAFKVAVVKIETPLAGADGVTHLKVGFIPPPMAVPNAGIAANAANAAPPAANARGPAARQFRPGMQIPELKEGQEFLFFLTRHPSGQFHAMHPTSPPIELKGDEGKKQLEAVKKALTTLADPMKGLKSDKAEVRYETAALLLTKYRAYPDFGGEVAPQPVPAEESRLILSGLAAGDWTKFTPDGPNGPQTFYTLGLTEADGWKLPVVPPGQNPNQVIQDAFVQWLAGPGKDYRVKRNVPKRK
jgi:hypothetical protein